MQQDAKQLVDENSTSKVWAWIWAWIIPFTYPWHTACLRLLVVTNTYGEPKPTLQVGAYRNASRITGVAHWAYSIGLILLVSHYAIEGLHHCALYRSHSLTTTYTS